MNLVRGVFTEAAHVLTDISRTVSKVTGGLPPYVPWLLLAWYVTK